MSNAAPTRWKYEGKILHYPSDIKAAKLGGGDQEEIRGITPSRRALGWRKGQYASYKITFKVDVVNGSQEVRWDNLSATKTEFTMQSDKSDITHVYSGCVVDSCEETTGARNETIWDVSISALYRETVV
jgi:hypothetical protein